MLFLQQSLATSSKREEQSREQVAWLAQKTVLLRPLQPCGGVLGTGREDRDPVWGGGLSGTLHGVLSRVTAATSVPAVLAKPLAYTAGTEP